MKMMEDSWNAWSKKSDSFPWELDDDDDDDDEKLNAIEGKEGWGRKVVGGIKIKEPENKRKLPTLLPLTFCRYQYSDLWPKTY